MLQVQLPAACACVGEHHRHPARQRGDLHDGQLRQTQQYGPNHLGLCSRHSCASESQVNNVNVLNSIIEDNSGPGIVVAGGCHSLPFLLHPLPVTAVPFSCTAFHWRSFFMDCLSLPYHVHGLPFLVHPLPFLAYSMGLPLLIHWFSLPFTASPLRCLHRLSGTPSTLRATRSSRAAALRLWPAMYSPSTSRATVRPLHRQGPQVCARLKRRPIENEFQ